MRKAERPALPSTAAGHQESSACQGGPGDALGRNPAMMFGFCPRTERGKLPGDSRPNGARGISHRQPPRLPPGLARGLCSVFLH